MNKLEIAKVPHSWSLANWPPAVWPHEPAAVRWLLHSQRDELMRAGALVRPGRTLVVLGVHYLAWLQRKVDRVADFKIAPNVDREQRRGAKAA